jgi:hypothetical protein
MFSNIKQAISKLAAGAGMPMRARSLTINFLSCVRLNVLASLAVLSLTLSSIAQNQALTGFTDSYGEHIFYVGMEDFHVHQLAWVPSLGRECDMDITAQAGAGAANYGSDLVSFTNSNGEHAYYIDIAQHVHQFFRSSSNGPADCTSSFVDQDLTYMTKGVLADAHYAGSGYAQGSMTGFTNNRGEHVYYIGVDGHVHHLFYNFSSGSETDEDLSASASRSSNCPGPVEGSALASVEDGTNEKVYYVGTNQHICQLSRVQFRILFCNPLTHLCTYLYVWGESGTDLTAVAGGTPPRWNSALTAFADSTGEHVYYISTNQNIYELFWNPATNTETSRDVTTRFGADAVGATSSLASFSNSIGQHVYYADASLNVNQINLTTQVVVDLTRWTGAPLLGGGCGPSPLLSFSNSAGEHVYWVGDDDHVHQFYSPTNVNNWYNQDLTQAGGGVVTGGCPPM